MSPAIEPILAELQRWLAWAGDYPLAGALLALGLVLAVTGLIAEIAAHRRRREIMQALRDSTRSELHSERRTGRHSDRVSFLPPPDPFAQLSVEFSMAPVDARLGGLLGLLGLRRQQLALHGSLRSRLGAEVTWERGRAPDRALGRSPSTHLWTSRRLDFVDGAYAVHGTNTASLEHAFVDLQTRFGAYTQRVLLQANAKPQVVILLRVGGFNREDMPALVATVLALARSSLHQ